MELDRQPDPGARRIDFQVSDGRTTSTETVQVTVKESGGVGSPVFRQPLGTGTTLDLSKHDCIDVKVLVEDTDSTEVSIDELPPFVEGAQLMQTGPFDAETPDNHNALA